MPRLQATFENSLAGDTEELPSMLGNKKRLTQVN